MKNIQKIAVSLVVAASAIAFSAFKTVNKEVAPFGNKQLNAGMITNDYLLQDQGTAGVFSQGSIFSSDNCDDTVVTLRCGYSVSATGKANIPEQATYNATEINTYVSNGWISSAPGSSNRLYAD